MVKKILSGLLPTAKLLIRKEVLLCFLMIKIVFGSIYIYLIYIFKSYFYRNRVEIYKYILLTMNRAREREIDSDLYKETGVS